MFQQHSGLQNCEGQCDSDILCHIERMMYTIYRISNKLNGKSYIGFTVSNPPMKRFEKHKKNARIGQENYLYRAMRKDGFDNFFFEPLCYGEEHVAGLKVAEPLMIELFTPEYNMTKGGDGVLGLAFSEEQNRQNSIRQKGKKKSPRTKEHCRNIANSKRGISKSEECKKKISLSKMGIPAYWNIGRIVSPETRLKQSISAKNRVKR